jgi:hypothetical protein
MVRCYLESRRSVKRRNSGCYRVTRPKLPARRSSGAGLSASGHDSVTRRNRPVCSAGARLLKNASWYSCFAKTAPNGDEVVTTLPTSWRQSGDIRGENSLEHRNVKFLWREPGSDQGFRSGVCLHGHTMHSEECLDFLPRYLHRIPGVSQLVRRYQRRAVSPTDFARAYRFLPWTHALELNGTRSWTENQAVIELAETCSRPIVSGVDRHACEPSACINLTQASTFAEFAQEIRGGASSILFSAPVRDSSARESHGGSVGNLTALSRVLRARAVDGSDLLSQ